jgi:hypothetical protein
VAMDMKPRRCVDAIDENREFRLRLLL